MAPLVVVLRNPTYLPLSSTLRWLRPSLKLTPPWLLLLPRRAWRRHRSRVARELSQGMPQQGYGQMPPQQMQGMPPHRACEICAPL